MNKYTPLKSGGVTHLKRKHFENLIFSCYQCFCVRKLIVWYLNISSIDLATRYKIGMYLLSVTEAFPRSTDIIQFVNELPTDKINIRVPQDELMCPAYVNNKTKQVFEKYLKGGVHDLTSVESL